MERQNLELYGMLIYIVVLFFFLDEYLFILYLIHLYNYFLTESYHHLNQQLIQYEISQLKSRIMQLGNNFSFNNFIFKLFKNLKSSTNIFNNL